MTTKAKVKAMMERIDGGCDITKEEFSYMDLAHLTLSYAINEVRKGNTHWSALFNEIGYQAKCLAEESGMKSYIIEAVSVKLFSDYASEYDLNAMSFAE